MNKTDDVLDLDIGKIDQFTTQYTTEALSVQPEVARVSVGKLSAIHHENLILLDIGADKVFVAEATAAGPDINQIGEATTFFYKDGPILPFLKKTLSSLAQSKQFSRVAISSHGQIASSKYLNHIVPKLGIELTEANYTNDLARYIHDIVPLSVPPTMFNDAVCGAAFAYTALEKMHMYKKHIIYFIVGGGVGGCHIDEHGVISSAEPGHIEWLPYADDIKPSPCLQSGPKFCAEVYSCGPYLETVLATHHIGEPVPGRKMNTLLSEGRDDVAQVYRHGARNATSVIIGMLYGFWLLNEKDLTDSVIVVHGGVADNVTAYVDMLKNFTMDYLQTKFPALTQVPFIQSNKILAHHGQNAGALGAGILSLSQ